MYHVLFSVLYILILFYSLNDRNHMPYIEAFINEVLRFSTITPFVAHATPEDTTLGDYNIPKQTLVIGNLWGIHHDRKVFLQVHIVHNV